jgi:hypothetical protein
MQSSEKLPQVTEPKTNRTVTLWTRKAMAQQAIAKLAEKRGMKKLNQISQI